jgi:hypothetical protein
MGLFRTSDSIIGRAMPLTAALVGAPNALPAWVFENQTGTLGTYLNSSVLYIGVSGDVSVILPGVTLGDAEEFRWGPIVPGTSVGTGYTVAATVLTTECPNNLATGLTLEITGVGGGGEVQSVDIVAGGSGYNVNDIVTIVDGANKTAKIKVNKVGSGIPISAQAITFKGVPAGTILPVAVDYVTALATVTAADIIVGR